MSEQFAGGNGGGTLPYETTDGLDSHGTINRYRKRGHSYVDRVQARYTNDSDEATEIEVAFALPDGSTVVEWLLPDDAEETTRAPRAIIANLPDESIDQQDILSRQDEFDFYSYDIQVPAESEDFDGEIRPGRVRCGVEIESELGQENELGVWILGSFAGGSGTSSDPYQIENWNHLDSVRDNVDDSFELIANLDSNSDGYSTHVDNPSEGWDPIGYTDDAGDNIFTGVFDGNGYSISDMEIDKTGDNAALFGHFNGATFKDLAVINAKIDIDDSRAALIAAGRDNDSSADSLFENCFAHGEINGGRAVGGIAGEIQYESEIKNCYAIVDIDTSHERVGGLVGYLRRGDELVENCYATGPVNGGVRTGGLVGWDRFNADIIDSYWDEEESDQDDGVGSGGTNTSNLIGLNTNDMQGSSAETEMDNLDFDDTWETVEESDADATNDGYPILQSIDRQTQLESQGISSLFLIGKVTQDGNVENATVVAVNLDTGELEGITTTDANGEYEFNLSNLDIFPYKILVAVDYEDSDGDRFGRAKTIQFDP